MAGRALRKVPVYPPGVQSAVDYADDVIAGRVDAGHLVHLTCERFNREIDEDTWEVRPELAELAMDVAGSMPNIKGIEAGKVCRARGQSARRSPRSRRQSGGPRRSAAAVRLP